jgi:hypothetical protein
MTEWALGVALLVVLMLVTIVLWRFSATPKPPVKVIPSEEVARWWRRRKP